MQITNEKLNNTIKISMDGELGHHEAKKCILYLESIIDLYDEENIILDLTSLNFMDSSGIAVIMSAYRNSRDRYKNFRVLNAPTQALKVLDAAGITKLIKFEQEVMM